jgi:hypothetical protein
MKNLKFRKMLKLAFVLTVIVMISTSCKKDDEVSPDYVGTWIATESSSETTGGSQTQEIITFTTNEVYNLIKMSGATAGVWVDYASMKGTISVSGNKMSVTVNELGISPFDQITGLPTGAITSYKAGSSTFDILMGKSGQNKIFTSEYSVSGNKLTLKSDNNDDGDYLDEGESTVFTKQ